jgi:hypothetical protein
MFISEPLPFVKSFIEEIDQALQENVSVISINDDR